jgi:parvulin-like peptidyl-prolyl isomerase
MAFCLSSFAAKIKDVVVAEVNGISIYKSTLLKYHEQNLKVVRGNKKITINSSLNDLVDRIIGIQSGKENKIDQQPNIIKKMNDIVYHAQISKDISPLLKKIKVTDGEIKKYYKNNPEYRTSQILLRLRALPSQDDVASTLEKALGIYQELQKKPSLFGQFAQKYGQTSTAANGGDIGYQPRVRLSPEYFSAINGKKNEYVAKPFRTQFGIHIVKVTGSKEFKQIDMNLYKKIIYDVQRDKILSKYFQGKRKSAKLKIFKKNLEL